MNNTDIDLGEEAFNDCRKLVARISDLERTVKSLSEKLNEIINAHNELEVNIKEIIKNSKNGEKV